MNRKTNIRTVILLTLLLGSHLAFSQTAEELLPKAIQLEEVKGELEQAIEIYQSIVNAYPDNRPIAARAYLHMGRCYEKLGMEEARKAYQKVLDNYPEQKQEMTLAKERLNQLLALQEAPHKPSFKKIRIPTELSWNLALSPDGQKLLLVSDKKLSRSTKLWLKLLPNDANEKKKSNSPIAA